MARRLATVHRQRLGAQLRKLREERGLTLEEAAARVMMSKSALSRMEKAQVGARAHEVDYILVSYGYEKDDDLRSALVGLATGGRSRDWTRRHKLPGKGPNYGEYVMLEQDSSEFFAYHADLIPGLLQTPEYAHAVMSSVPSSGLTNIEEGVTYRMARKEALDRPDPLSIKAVIGEAAICQWMGGLEVMIAQLRYLLELIQRPNIDLRVFPFTAPTHPGVDGSFIILDVEVGNFPVVVVDALRRRFFIDDDESVAAYRRVQDELCCLALSKTETGERLERAIRDLRIHASERIKK
ncbi:helix-turn-helix domain-containing protein [Actinomadura welshii]|uniref:helix-turn-helix domain-containing protein n=1 Tax=Actinomadura welshii TaxID=3103817 RepID=UPI0003FB9B2D|nr:helix-turn-helix transcriptional regulator [Actinomadura madurae]